LCGKFPSFLLPTIFQVMIALVSDSSLSRLKTEGLPFAITRPRAALDSPWIIARVNESLTRQHKKPLRQGQLCSDPRSLLRSGRPPTACDRLYSLTET
jgi:hypothetical protein